MGHERGRSKRRAAGCILSVCAMLGFLAPPSIAADLKKNDPCPSFRLNPLKSPQGPGVSLEEIVKSGKPVVLSFFATWCAPCLREIPVLESVAKSQGIGVYLVNVDSGPVSLVEDFVKARGVTLPVLLDPEGVRAASRYGVVSPMGTAQIPQLFLLAPDKTLWWRHRGASSALEKELAAQVRDLRADFAARPPKEAAPAGPGRFWLVFTNSANGYVAPCGCADQPFGGLTRRSTKFKEIRNEIAAGSLLFVDTGDNDAPRAPSPEAMARALDLLRYDARVLGDQDILRAGVDARNVLVGDGRPLLGMNYEICDSAGCAALPPYRIVQRGQIKIGIVGVMDPDVLALLPKDWKRWVKVSDYKKKLRGVIEGLRRDVDVVMVLAHSGLDADQRMAEEIPGIDLVVGGHSQTLMKEPLRVENLKSGTSAWIVQAGGNGQYVGKVLVRVKPDKTVALENYELIPLTEDIEDDPGLLSLLPR